MRLLFIFVLSLLNPLFLLSQAIETPEPYYIKSIQFKGGTNQAQLPIIRLGGKLVLSFDDLRANEADYYYRISHYNFDWTPSDLSKGEYLDGFDDVRIEQYTNSFNSLQLYAHYEVAFPNRETRALKKSGNYMIHIYNDDGDLVFARKFMLLEDQVTVGVAIKRSRDLAYIDTKQAVQFTIYSNDKLLINPDRSVKTMVLQNSNLKTAITDLKPQYTMGQELIYRYDQPAAFWAGNEFLNFDSKEARVANVGIRRIELNDLFEHYLYTQSPRKNRPYTYYPDINGNFVVRSLGVQNSQIEAEYIFMHFGLRYDEPLNGRKLYVNGNFNNYDLNVANELLFNTESGLYETVLLLKQGFYNYNFALEETDGTVNLGAVDGNYWQTENQYSVLVYYRGPGDRYDQLIGMGQGNSNMITTN